MPRPIRKSGRGKTLSLNLFIRLENSEILLFWFVFSYILLDN